MPIENNDQEISAGGGELPPPPAPQAPAPPPPPSPEAELRGRLERAEAWIEALYRMYNESAESAQLRVEKAASKDDLKNTERKIFDLSSSVDGLKRTFAREGELAARLEAAESSLAGLKTSLEGQQGRAKAGLEALATKDELDALRVSASGNAAALDEMKKRFAQFSEEFSGVERECRKALGEAQGYARAAAQHPVAAQFEEYLKESVSRLGAKVGEVETALHAGLAEISGRMTASEVLYKKMFAAAEENLKKSVEPQLKDLEGQLRWLRENLVRLSDDYAVVTERKIRALEAKTSAFEAMARRMDAIDAAMKKGGRIGLP